MKRIVSFVLLISLACSGLTRADEGMWLPLLLKKSEADMQKAGCKLTSEEIYSVNSSSLKDAIVSLGGFCTAEMVSADGLMLTNHHCGFDAVQSHSTVEHDYITNGFWAMNRSEELTNPGLTAAFLVRMEDVSERVKSQLSDTMSEGDRMAALGKIFKKLSDENSESGRYRVDVKPFFAGNEFYMFVYEVFKDVRLVGAPPKSIGNYGGDTDNWMWPRQTGDFSMFRVYCGPDGKPAEYSKDNVPYHPKHFLPVSMSGVGKDDYTMIMGYPGRTDRYATSGSVRNAIEQVNPAIVKLRTKRLDVIKQDMEASDKVRIMYASKYAQVANYWKYFIGQTKGLKRLQVVEQKEALEKRFNEWANGNADTKKKFGNVTNELTKAYGEMHNYNIARTYLQEGVFGTEILPYAYSFNMLEAPLSAKKPDAAEISKITAQLSGGVADHFNEYNEATDLKVFAALMDMYCKDVPAEQQAPYLVALKGKYKGDFNKMAEEIFEHSLFVDSSKVNDFLAKPSLKKLSKDPAYMLVKNIFDHYVPNLRTPIRAIQTRIDKNQRLFVEGLRLMDNSRNFYPDANSTMRLTYGKVEDYDPQDAVHYDLKTTIEGVMEKWDNSNEEFVLPAKYVELYKKKDYGQYGANGTLPVNFLTTNDITGGNSGSPVINAKGELIGLAFDGNWEAMSGDIAYDATYKRTICVDVRYVLWVIDKFAGAGHLVKEMQLK